MHNIPRSPLPPGPTAARCSVPQPLPASPPPRHTHTPILAGLSTANDVRASLPRPSMVSSSPSLGGSKATDGDVSNFTAFLQASPKSFVVVEFFTHWCNGHQPRRSWSTHAMQPNWMKLGLGAFFVGLTEFLLS